MNVRCPKCSRDNSNISESATGKNIICCHCGTKFLVEVKPSSPPQQAQSQLSQPPLPKARTSELTLDQVRTLWSGTIISQDNLELSIKPDAKKASPSFKLKNNIRVMRMGESEQLETGDKPNDLELVDFIGSGGMGVVFRANQKSIERKVAVKIIKPEIATDESTRENFIREAMVTGNLEHPNIVPVHELGSLEDGTLFYSMKEVRGVPWKDAIKTKAIVENLEILMKVCDAMAFAHDKGVIHRDLKPENVMLGEYGEVMVMDWGLAVNVNRDAKSINAEILSEESGHAGTPAYMAPEMASCDYRNIGKRSDIYLLGAILYEIVGGMKPHAGTDVFDCLHNAAKNIIRPCEGGGELLDIARRAMSTRPEDRYPGVKDLQNAIRDYQKHSESIALYESAVEHLEKAQSTSKYELYAQAVFGFREALKLWPNNINAKMKLAEANHEYAKCAYSKNDLDLAMSLLNSANRDHLELVNKVDNAYKDRGRKKKLLRNLTYGSAGLAAGIILILLVSVLWIHGAKQETLKVKEIAGKDKLLLAQEADKAKESEAQAKQEVVKISNTTQKFGYRLSLSVAKDKIDKSQFGDAAETLKSTPVNKRNIEWGLLRNMCRTENKGMEFEGQFCAISPDEKTVALLINKGKSLIISNISGEEVCRFDFDENDKTSYRINSYKNAQYNESYSGVPVFSPDGKYLLTGNTIFDLNAKKGMRKLPDFSNLSRSGVGTPCFFSYDSKFLIVRCHDETRKAVDEEKNKPRGYTITNPTDWIEVYDLVTLKLVWSSSRIKESTINVPAKGNIVAICKNAGEKPVRRNTEILDLRNGGLLKTLDFDVVSLSPQGDVATVRTADYKELLLWDIPKNRELQKIAIAAFSSKLEFTSDGKKLFGLTGLSSGGGNPNEPRKSKAISIYDIDKKEMKSIELKEDLFESSRSINIEYMPNDCRYAKFSLSSGPMDISKIVYDLDAGKIIYQVSLNRGKTNPGFLSPTGSFCISGDELKTKIAPVFEMTSNFRESSTYVFYAISPDNKFFVMPDSSQRQGGRPPGNYSICNMETKQVKAKINMMEAINGKDSGANINPGFTYPESIKISPDSDKAIISASCRGGGALVSGNYIFSMETGGLIESILSAEPAFMNALSTIHFSPYGGNAMKILGSTNADKTQNLSFVDSKSGKEYYSIKNIPKGSFRVAEGDSQNEVKGVGSIAYSPDKTLVAISSSQQWRPGSGTALIIYDIKQNKLISSFSELQKPILFSEFTKDGKRLIGLAPKQTFSPGGTMNPNNYFGYILTFWDLEINEELLSIEYDFGFPVMSMSLSPDGHHLRFGGDKAEIWTATDWTR